MTDRLDMGENRITGVYHPISNLGHKRYAEMLDSNIDATLLSVDKQKLH